MFSGNQTQSRWLPTLPPNHFVGSVTPSVREANPDAAGEVDDRRLVGRLFMVVLHVCTPRLSTTSGLHVCALSSFLSSGGFAVQNGNGPESPPDAFMSHAVEHSVPSHLPCSPIPRQVRRARAGSGKNRAGVRLAVIPPTRGTHPPVRRRNLMTILKLLSFSPEILFFLSRFAVVLRF